MLLLIIQPKLEQDITQLEDELRMHPSVDAVIFPEGYLNENVEEACALARTHNKILIGGYRRMNESPKDRAIVIDRSGQVVLDRAKYSMTSFVEIEDLVIGHILCDELVVQGIRLEAEEEAGRVNLVVHPIGVGMFSDEQFDEWIQEARKLATTYNVMVIGTSHADGSFRGSDISIPIAYCLDRDGTEVFVAKDDTRTRVFDLKTKKVMLPTI